MTNGFLKNLYYNIFSNYNLELEKVMKDCKSVLDVGCGETSPIKNFSKRLYAVGVDVYKPMIIKSKKNKIHNKYYVMDVMKIDKKFKNNSFDCVLASDLIEHLDKKSGLELIKKMTNIARKKVIIFTPNGFLEQGAREGNIFQVHKSGWNVNEMQKLGFRVIGINGIKFLRGEYSTIKFKPEIIFRFISDITQLITKYYPKLAFQMLCIKEKRD